MRDGAPLAMHLPHLWSAASRELMTGFFLQFPLRVSLEKRPFRSTLAQLILAALSIYLFDVKEGPEGGFLSDVPFRPFRITYVPFRRIYEFSPHSNRLWQFWDGLQPPGTSAAGWLQAAARCEQACFDGRVHGQDPCLHTLSKHCLSDVPPDRLSLAMYPLGGFAEAPLSSYPSALSSYPSDSFLLISLPRGLKTLVDVPFLSFGCDFLEIFGGHKMAPERLF